MPASVEGLSLTRVVERLDGESIFQLFWSHRDLFETGESAGVRERFSPREGTLLSVSAVEVAELDMRRAS